jgi:hypothetical protein
VKGGVTGPVEDRGASFCGTCSSGAGDGGVDLLHQFLRVGEWSAVDAHRLLSWVLDLLEQSEVRVRLVITVVMLTVVVQSDPETGACEIRGGLLSSGDGGEALGEGSRCIHAPQGGEQSVRTDGGGLRRHRAEACIASATHPQATASLQSSQCARRRVMMSQRKGPLLPAV